MQLENEVSSMIKHKCNFDLFYFYLRAGLHSKFVRALRRLKNIDTIVFVSCNT